MQTAPLTRGGIVFRVHGRPLFLPAELALKVVPRPQIARVPGAPPGLLGLALSDGVILPVLELGAGSSVASAMIVCVHGSEQLGLVGVTDIVSGMFPASGADGVIASDTVVPALDLEEIYARVHPVTWGAGWGG